MHEKKVFYQTSFVDKKLQICKMSKLHIFEVTNICKLIL
jgi:hypothetical protein